MNQVLRRKSQWLPNECLLMVIECLNDDLQTLNTLLRVNTFFFKAAVPLVYANPLKFWCDVNYQAKPHPNLAVLNSTREKLAVLLLASVIHSQRTVAQPGVFKVAEFLEKHDVLIALTPLAQDVVHGAMPTTIDYSNHESLETICLDHFHSHRFLPMTDKFPSLKTLQLTRQGAYTQGWADDIVTFINAHHTAFPRKKRLRIEFTDDCDMGLVDWDPSAGTPEAMLERERRMNKGKLRIAFYKAIGDPSEMTATHCPGFYGMAGNIGVNSLIKFTDRDSYRLLYGEGSQQAVFWQRCMNLKILEVSVRDPGTFSWAIEKSADGGSRRHSGNYLRNLKRLSICMDTSLLVVDNAVVAFGQSLEYLKVSGRMPPQEISHETLFNPQLVKNVRVGNWNFPSLISLNLDLDTDSQIFLGRFDQCPCVEALSLRIRSVKKIVVPIPPMEFIDPVCPAPVWKMPRLRSLRLYCKAALMFDFDSLDNMPALEVLVMVSAGDDQPIPDAYLQPLSLYRSRQGSPKTTEGAPSLGASKWKDHWNLPRLKTVHLEGPPSWVFCFQWLKGCPSLESIRLTTREGFQRLPLSTLSMNASKVPAGTLTRLQPKKTDLENVDDSGFEQGLAPLVGSKLQRITLQGPWVMSEHDLSKVLNIYAPNLMSLKTDLIHAVSPQQQTSWHSVQFLKVIANSIGSGGRPGQSETGMKGASVSPLRVRSGSKLRYICSAYNIDNVSRKDFRDMGLAYVPKDTLKEYQKRGACVFEFGRFGLVRSEDRSMGAPTPKTTEGQTLPSECLLVVVECLSDDLETLRTLLFVNKLFFNVAVVLIYIDPIYNWAKTRCHQTSKIAALLASVSIPSAVQYNRLESKLRSCVCIFSSTPQQDTRLEPLGDRNANTWWRVR
ncbi:hypothetical protein BG005_005009 [Podila minutissima]|nr:hypothetical protein BG005_005009 [Podila minutissima]